MRGNATGSFTRKDERIASLEISDPVGLKGQRALINAGSKAIGAAVVAQLAQAGAQC